MARFPKVPGAGAKRIGNPVYWSRMTIQNERYKKTSGSAKALWQTRYKHLWMVYDEIWEGELQEVASKWGNEDDLKFQELNEKCPRCVKNTSKNEKRNKKITKYE